MFVWVWLCVKLGVFDVCVFEFFYIIKRAPSPVSDTTYYIVTSYMYWFIGWE